MLRNIETRPNWPSEMSNQAPHFCQLNTVVIYIFSAWKMEDSLLEEQTLRHSHGARGFSKVKNQSMYEYLLRWQRAQRFSITREDSNVHEVRFERVQIALRIARRKTHLKPIDLTFHYLGRISWVCTYYYGLHWSDERLKQLSNRHSQIGCERQRKPSFIVRSSTTVSLIIWRWHRTS